MSRQCVPFARQVCERRYGYTFPQVAHAYQIADLHGLQRAAVPRAGDLVVWKPVSDYAPHGHVAVVTRASKDGGWADVVERNAQGDGKVGTRRVDLKQDRDILCVVRPRV